MRYRGSDALQPGRAFSDHFSEWSPKARAHLARLRAGLALRLVLAGLPLPEHRRGLRLLRLLPRPGAPDLGRLRGGRQGAHPADRAQPRSLRHGGGGRDLPQPAAAERVLPDDRGHQRQRRPGAPPRPRAVDEPAPLGLARALRQLHPRRREVRPGLGHGPGRPPDADHSAPSRERGLHPVPALRLRARRERQLRGLALRDERRDEPAEAAELRELRPARGLAPRALPRPLPRPRGGRLQRHESPVRRDRRLLAVLAARRLLPRAGPELPRRRCGWSTSCELPARAQRSSRRASRSPRGRCAPSPTNPVRRRHDDASASTARRGASAAERIAEIRARLQAALVYPPYARRQGLEGTSRIQFTIGPDGRAQDVRTAASSGHASLDRAAERCAVDAGQLPRVLGRLDVPIRFSLEDERRHKRGDGVN